MKIKSFLSLVLLCAIAGGVTPTQAQSPSKEQTIGFIVETLNKCGPYTAKVSSNEVMTFSWTRDKSVKSGRTKFALKHMEFAHISGQKVRLNCRGEEGLCVDTRQGGNRFGEASFYFSRCPAATDSKLVKAFTHLIKFYDAENKSLF